MSKTRFALRGFGPSSSGTGSRRWRQFENNYFTEMCSDSEAGSYLRLIDFVYHSTLGLRVIKKKKKVAATLHGAGNVSTSDLQVGSA